MPAPPSKSPISGSDKWSERELILALSRHFDRIKNICIPNLGSGLTGWEADFVVLYPSGWAVEVECKTSIADLQNEFRKKADKYEFLLDGIRTHRVGARKIVTQREHTHHLCKHFYYAVPTELVEKTLILAPSWVGVLSVRRVGGGYHHVAVVRKPQTLKHGRKVSAVEKLRMLMSVYYRFWSHKVQS